MTLTPAIIQDLRASITYRGSSDSTNPIGVAFIVYIPVDDAFALHAYGGCQAVSADVSVLAEMLRQERAEAGFIRRVLDPASDAQYASLDPAARLRLDIQRRAEAAKAAEHTRTLAAEAASRVSKFDLSRISLDDL